MARALLAPLNEAREATVGCGDDLRFLLHFGKSEKMRVSAGESR